MLNAYDAELGKRKVIEMTRLTMPKFQCGWFQEAYYQKLNDFAKGKIKKLMIFIPPQHGKSEGSTRRLPAYLIGKNPNLRLAIISYNATKARKFNREIQRIIAEPSYQAIFPQIKLSNGSDGYSKTFDEFELVGFEGSVKTVGVDGSLTGDPVDILIMDDLYKNWTEAQSDKTRATVQDWYDSVADTRLHNDSQQLIVFTRWHEYDLAGYLLDKEPDEWEVFLYPALKIGPPTVSDPREHGDALYPEKHSREKLEKARARNEHNFDSLYQQNPKPIAGLLFAKSLLHFYDPDEVKLNDPDFTYIAADPADEGGDDFAAGPGKLVGDKIYLTEILYNTEGADFNEEHLVKMIIKNKASAVGVESVFGWKETALRVKTELEEKNFEGEYRLIKPRTNKHSRILNRSSFIKNHFYFRSDYEKFEQYSKFMRNLTSYLKIQEPSRKNKHDDAPDLCEMIASYYEKNFAHLFGTGKNQ
jgi:hypothetical protein